MGHAIRNQRRAPHRDASLIVRAVVTLPCEPLAWGTFASFSLPRHGVRKAPERVQDPAVHGVPSAVVDPESPVARGSPTHGAPLLLQAASNAVVAEQRTPAAGWWGSRGRCKRSKRLLRASIIDPRPTGPLTKDRASVLLPTPRPNSASPPGENDGAAIKPLPEAAGVRGRRWRCAKVLLSP